MLECITGNEPVLCTTTLQICYGLLVTAMHFNENFKRAQATAKSGTERIKLYSPNRSKAHSPLK